MAMKIRKLLAMLTLLCVLLCAIPMQALAAADEGLNLANDVIDVVVSIPESGKSTESIDVETDNGKLNPVEVKVDATITENEEDGTTNYEADLSANNAKDENQNKVDYTGKVDITVNEGGEIIDGSVVVNYDVENKKYTAEGSYSASFEADPNAMNGATVEIPLEEGASNTVVSGDEVGDKTVSGNVPKNENDGNYNYTSTTVTHQGSVTVETTDIEFEEKISEKTDLDYVKTETNPTDSNDLNHVGEAPEAFLPGYDGEPVIPEGVDGYDYVYVGSSNTSKYFPAIVFESPLTDEDKLAQYGENAYIKKNSITWYYVKWLNEEDKLRIAYDENNEYVTDEEGYILDIDGNRIFKEERTEVRPDGSTSYLHRFDNYKDSLFVEGWYEDGKWVEELNGDKSFGAIWSGPQQFVLVDGDGNIITTYCADFTTPTQDNFGYNMENLEDADYYTKEEAKMIRSIAANGYWGTEDGVGSLDAMKATLKAAGFSDEELASLNDGVALTATQMAIWSCSNKMSGLEFINAHYSNWGPGNVPTEKEDEVKLLFKLYDYLMNLKPTELENTTADTIINKDNFVDDMKVTVVKKADDHANNKDDNKDNDAYYVNLSFALVVTPSTENGDDLVVNVVSEGKVIATGRVAGELQEGETQLNADEEGNYTFNNIIFTEGEQTFNLNLEGIQNLDAGVYLYSSEIRTEGSDETSSQTLVGLAGGKRGVDVSMAITFEFNEDEQVVAKETVTRRQRNNPTRTTNPPTTIEEDPVPLSDGLEVILDEEVPLADAPETGDNSIVWLMMSIVSAMGLCMIVFAKKQCKE